MCEWILVCLIIKLTYLLHGAVLLEKLTGFQLAKKFPTFYGTRRFITAFTSVWNLSLSSASSIQSIPPHSTSSRSTLILSSHYVSPPKPCIYLSSPPYTIAVCAVKNFWWWTEELYKTCRVLLQRWIWEVGASGWFYCGKLSWCMVNWTSNSKSYVLLTVHPCIIL